MYVLLATILLLSAYLLPSVRRWSQAALLPSAALVLIAIMFIGSLGGDAGEMGIWCNINVDQPAITLSHGLSLQHRTYTPTSSAKFFCFTGRWPKEQWVMVDASGITVLPVRVSTPEKNVFFLRNSSSRDERVQ